MAAKRVAVVTGSNKGIGLSIVKGLLRLKFDGDVYLLARNPELGKAAVVELKGEGLEPCFHQLDITDQSSIDKFRDYLKDTYGGLDVLVNNAGIAFKNAATESFEVQAAETLRVNNFSTINVCNALFPLLRPHARVVNLSSMCGMLSNIPSQELKKRFVDPELTIDKLIALLQEFIQAAKDGTAAELGWGSSSYNVSKVGVTAMTKIQQRMFDQDSSRPDIIVNAVHPGYVDTDMSSHKGPLSPDQGAEAPVYLSLLPPNVKEPKGQMVWNDKRVVEWGLNE